MAPSRLYSPNLAEVDAAETAICRVRGDIGELTYRGQAVGELAKKPFLDVVWLLLFGELPNEDERATLTHLLNQHRALSDAELQQLAALPASLHPMLMLQSMVPTLSLPSAEAPPFTTSAYAGLAIAAKLPALVAAWQRLRNNLAPVPSDVSQPIHHDFLHMLHGKPVAQGHADVLDKLQILQLEHSLNISTYVSRICAGTEANMQAVMGSALATLSGVLHGGADQAALELARNMGSAQAAPVIVKDMLSQKQKIMGMGHRDYKTVDPRALVIKPMAQSFCTSEESRKLYETLAAIEQACQAHFAERGKQIFANMEFYKGVVMHQLGIPDDCFTAVFAMSRIYGWLAHSIEFSQKPYVIRPGARYIGK